MRPKHARFVKRGANVVAPATAFDVDDTHGWFRATYGDRWVFASVRGVVRRVRGTLVYVHGRTAPTLHSTPSELSYCNRIQRVVEHATNRCVEHERNLVESVQWFYVCVQVVHQFVDYRLKTY